VWSLMKSSRANGNREDELFWRTCKVWQPCLGRDLSREDSRQIVENITGFFCILAEWSQAEMASRRTIPTSPIVTEQLDGPLDAIVNLEARCPQVGPADLALGSVGGETRLAVKAPRHLEGAA
jgi:hypothetical protein